jgi:hypothetical protein
LDRLVVRASLVLVVATGCFFEPERPHCGNAIRDQDETGIDCGGSCAASCPGSACRGSADCVTDSCVNGYCELASGPPSWLAGPPLGTAREFLQCAVDASGEILAVGGSSSPNAGGATSTVEVLAPDSAGWTPGADLEAARAYPAVALASGTVYAYAGLGTDTNPVPYIEGYIEANDGNPAKWAAIASQVPTQPGPAVAVGGTDGNLYVVMNGSTYVFVPQQGLRGTWSPGGSAPFAVPVGVHNGLSLTRGSDGVIYAFGGDTTTFVAFDAQHLTWSARAQLGTMRGFAGAAGPPDGRIYAIGGDDAFSGSVEAYTPSADRWTTVASLSMGRDAHGTAVGPDGRIYAIGGATADSTNAGLPVNIVEIYGPALTLLPAEGTAGTSITVIAANFAVNAPLAVTFPNAVVNTLVATATTDAFGNATATFTVPPLPAGTYTVTAVDNKSQYPVQQSFRIQ